MLLVLTGLLLFVGLLSAWANTTVYDSATFSERTVDMLNDPAVRRELAKRLTEQLVLSGNQQAVAFRPAFQLAIEAAIDTDTFRSIFRTAVRRAHEAILANHAGGVGLNLSDSITVIASTLQLPNNLHHLSVSRHHCVLDINPPRVLLRDSGSRNGTYLNGKRVWGYDPKAPPEKIARAPAPDYAVQDGDTIRIGDTVFRVEITAPVEEAAAWSDEPVATEHDAELSVAG